VDPPLTSPGSGTGSGSGAGAGSGTGDKQCCTPPAGTICYIIDVVPPSAPHYPIVGSHYHLWMMNQAPDGRCFWNKIGGGASKTAPPGAIPCPFSRPPRSAPPQSAK
jgi:hypothetical protein